MLRRFWFWFNALPVVLGIFAIYKLNSFPPRGNFKDALRYCKDVDNERMLSVKEQSKIIVLITL